MSLVFVLGLILGLLLVLPIAQQGVGLVVIIFRIATLISVIMGLIGLVWYGFSLFLIYVGGLLVIFGYVVSMVPNFLFKQRRFSVFLVLGVSVSRVVSLKFFVLEGPFDVGGFIYSSGGFWVLIGLGLVLLFSLVCVVKVCYFSKGALRPFSV